MEMATQIPPTEQPTEAPTATLTEIATEAPPTEQPTEVPIPTPTEESHINVVEQAGLAHTMEIELLELDPNPPSSYTYKLTIIEPQVIEQVIGALDMDLQLGPRARRPAQYAVRFFLNDDTMQEFGYTYDPENPSFLRGDQDFWEGQDAEPSAEFNRLLQEQLASIPSLIGEQPVVGWHGLIVSLPDGIQFDDYLSLKPEDAGDLGLAGADAEVEAQIQTLRDSGRYAHFWGTLTCPLRDYGSCQLVVTRLRPDGAGPLFDPDPVEGWEGTIVSNPPEAQFDDHFVLAGDFPVRYGLNSLDPTVAAQLESLRDTQTTVHVWGHLTCGVPDSYGAQIQVTRVEEG